MRWKLLRRRLSVASPRVIIRSHVPWPLRWAMLAIALGFGAALALWAFEFGKEIAGLDRGAKAELAQLRAEVERLRADSAQARQIANTAQSLLRTGHATQDKLAQQLRQLEAERAGLQADLGFFERLLPVQGSGLQLRGLQASAAAPGQLRLQMLVMQSASVGGRDAPDFDGRWEVTLAGQLDGKPWTWRLPDGSRPLKVKMYARVDSTLEHPPGAVVKSVQARVLDAQGVTRATQTLRL
ncbi:MAG: hypothetical protein LW768_19825 [Rubrivivax sp.]|jgi:hypothetical protein|nr:hypothetical protein [Rubrivivax sp.]